MIIKSEAIFFALVGGIIPAIVWLLFWLREDRKRPEPRGLIMLTFFFGMIAVPLVIPLQKITFQQNSQFNTFLIWAILEETFKYAAAYFAALRKKEVDEPIDPIIYMLTAALGFAALENALFILGPLVNGNILESVLVGNLRFVGASLLHTISSATIGVALAISFFKRKAVRRAYLAMGIVFAIALHTVFNLFIIKETHSNTFVTFGFVWIAIVILMLLFERVKKIYPVNKI